MDKSSKKGLLKIVYNCRKATYLIEKRQIGQITLREKIELKIHLAGCSICRLFEKQSTVINRMVQHLFHGSNPTVPCLDEKFKNELQELIEDKLNES